MKHAVCTVKVKQPVKRKSATKTKTPAKKPKNPKPKTVPTKSKKRSHPEQSIETENSQPPAKKAKVAKVHNTRARKKSIYHSNFLNPVELSVEESAERKSNLSKFNELIGDSD